MHTKALDIAKNMFAKGLAANLIQELVGISREELRQLEKNLHKRHKPITT